MSDTIDIGKLVKKLRTQKGWSQLELIERSGLGKTTIQTIETGQNDNPEYKTLVTIFQTLGYHSIPISPPVSQDDTRSRLVNEIVMFLHSCETRTLEAIHYSLADTVHFVLDKFKRFPRG